MPDTGQASKCIRGMEGIAEVTLPIAILFATSIRFKPLFPDTKYLSKTTHKQFRLNLECSKIDCLQFGTCR